jgi:monofunctional biosynthetic peptidoglycan transglycosylase
MVATPKTKTTSTKTAAPDANASGGEPMPRTRAPLFGRGWRWWLGRVLAGIAGFYLALIVLFSFLPPPINLYQIGESWRLGGITKDWVSLDDIAPVMARSVVAAEDANFCQHWGFDIAAIREAVEEQSTRGASTLTQQVVKNTFLWHGRSWLRKAMEGVLTPIVELFWSKQRIVEVYLNVAEFDEGIFGVQAAAQHHFGIDARDLSEVQAARLAAVLPNPKERSASSPSAFVKKRTRAIIAGAQTIAVDGRARCFETSD